MIDFYKILGVPYDASEGCIRRAFYEKAKMYHPDVYKGEDGDAIFKLINEAYHTLTDPELRKKYDFKLRYGSVLVFSRSSKREAEERRERMRREYIRRRAEGDDFETPEEKRVNRKMERAAFWVTAGIFSNFLLWAVADVVINGRVEIFVLILFLIGLGYIMYRKFVKKSKEK
jgi:curved DNA-binding protein CbpA